MSRAVVLGSGGITGGAWEIGALKGLGDAGIDLTRAALFVGSSIGALLACLIQSGRSLDDLYTLYTVGAGPFTPTRHSSASGPMGNERAVEDVGYFHECLRLWEGAREDITVRIELGKRALATPHPISDEVQVASMKRRLAVDTWPTGLVKVAAVDVSDGTVMFFDGSQGVPIAVAVAASCAQPGLQAPVRVGDRRYMDGGTGGTNIDGAAGFQIVLAITAFPARGGTSHEIDLVRASGGQVIHLAPDEESRGAIGDPSDIRRARMAAEAGARQAAAVAPALRNPWTRS